MNNSTELKVNNACGLINIPQILDPETERVRKKPRSSYSDGGDYVILSLDHLLKVQTTTSGWL